LPTNRELLTVQNGAFVLSCRVVVDYRPRRYAHEQSGSEQSGRNCNRAFLI
jgi:hypothetical protein